VIEVTRSVETSTPVELVASYLSDFTTTASWDPHTRSCRRIDDGPVALGSEFDNVQRIGPLRSTFRYRVTQFDPGQLIVLESDSSSLHATDMMTFATAPAGTTVTYTARFELKGLARLGEPVLRRFMNKIADDGAAGLRRSLESLATDPGPLAP
jgi:carbon monoxide dehydrogenase subunit G